MLSAKRDDLTKAACQLIPGSVFRKGMERVEEHELDLPEFID